MPKYIFDSLAEIIGEWRKSSVMKENNFDLIRDRYSLTITSNIPFLYASFTTKKSVIQPTVMKGSEKMSLQ